jgi:hypothetical protein
MEGTATMKRWWPYSVFTAFVIAINVWAVFYNAWFSHLPFALALVPLNACAIWIVIHSRRKMRKLHLSYVARMEGLDRRLDHAIEREDWNDVALTCQLMRIWDHKPKRPVPSAPDGQADGGLSV